MHTQFNSTTVLLSELANVLGYNVINNTRVSSIAIDSRKIEKNCIFVAFQGQQHDGHKFVKQAEESGAIAAVVEQIQPNINIPQFQVPSSLGAIRELAICFRQKINCPVIALTGSNGKTTVKNMLASILPKPSFATIGNYNNQIGVPISLSHLLPEHLYAVFELGANKAGDIAYTVEMVKPTVALINNIGNAHLEGFGSEEGIAKAKGEIYAGLSPSGIAVINQDDKWHDFWKSTIGTRQIIKFALNNNPGINVFTKNLELMPSGCYKFLLNISDKNLPIRLRVPGLHSVHNALAAAACAYAAGVPSADIISGLEGFIGVAGRLMQLSGKKNSLILDDTYNANLNSFKAAIKVLSAMSGERILVMGDMGELGAEEINHHQQVGYFAKESGIEKIFTLGKLSQYAADAFGKGASHFDSIEELVAAILPMIGNESKILVKGSRSAAMERVVKCLAK